MMTHDAIAECVRVLVERVAHVREQESQPR
jgi:hypothetical protein